MFDRYHQDSIKGHTRIVRASGVTRRFHLQLATELPSQKVVLTVTQNKMQLTDLILRVFTHHIGSIFVGSQPERTPSILFCRSLLFSCHRLRDPYLRLVYQQMFCAGHLHSFCRVLVARREHCEWALSLLCDSDQQIVACAL